MGQKPIQKIVSLKWHLENLIFICRRVKRNPYFSTSTKEKNLNESKDIKIEMINLVQEKIGKTLEGVHKYRKLFSN